MHIYSAAGILAEDVCKNNGTPLNGTYQKCDCPTGFKGFDCSEKGDLDKWDFFTFVFFLDNSK
jgi:hypothetical protein